jgi:hypothetical protein
VAGDDPAGSALVTIGVFSGRAWWCADDDRVGGADEVDLVDRRINVGSGLVIGHSRWSRSCRS